VPVVLGGIVPASDLDKLIEIGVARIFTPADYELIDIMETIADIIEAGAGTGAR
jgi:(2R)-ethylmalonyl-CoA mutase